MHPLWLDVFLFPPFFVLFCLVKEELENSVCLIWSENVARICKWLSPLREIELLVFNRLDIKKKFPVENVGHRALEKKVVLGSGIPLYPGPSVMNVSLDRWGESRSAWLPVSWHWTRTSLKICPLSWSLPEESWSMQAFWQNLSSWHYIRFIKPF